MPTATATKATVREIREVFRQGEAFQESSIEGDMIHNVALLGTHSLNNRIYTEQAMADAVRLYAGAPVYIDHPTEGELRERGGSRSVMDLAGRIHNPRRSGDRVRGDIQMLNREPTRSLFQAIAEQMPDIAGMSHRARGPVSVNEEGVEVVEGLDAVAAVELVANPATVNGLFESVSKKLDQPSDFREQGEPSFSDITQMLDTALEKLEQPGQDDWLHVSAVFDDRVIYQINDGPLWQRAWSMDADGNVEVGDDRIEVRQVTTFEPVTEDDNTQEEEDMKINDLTAKQLRESRPDLVKALIDDKEEAAEAAKLREENKALQAKVDAAEAKDAERDRLALIEAKLTEAELPETVTTERFRTSLQQAKDEAEIDALIEDRKELVQSVGTGPKQPERDVDRILEATRPGRKGKAKPVTADTISEAADRLFV